MLLDGTWVSMYIVLSQTGLTIGSASFKLPAPVSQFAKAWGQPSRQWQAPREAEVEGEA